MDSTIEELEKIVRNSEEVMEQQLQRKQEDDNDCDDDEKDDESASTEKISNSQKLNKSQNKSKHRQVSFLLDESSLPTSYMNILTEFEEKDLTTTTTTSSSKSNNQAAVVKEAITKLLSDYRKIKKDFKKEKTTRKCKGKSVLKLAKQLTMRMKVIEKKDYDINNYLKKIELLEINVLSFDLQFLLECRYKQIPHEHKEEKEEKEQKTIKLSRENEQQKDKVEEINNNVRSVIKSLNETHSKECNELKIKIFQMNLEADSLRTELARVEMLGQNGISGSIRSLPNTIERSNDDTYYNDYNNHSLLNNTNHQRRNRLKYKSRSEMSKLSLIIFISVILFATIPTLFYHEITQTVLCSPITPGTILSSSTNIPFPTIYEAPWWVPKPFKSSVYNIICANNNTNNNGDDDSNEVVVSVLPLEKNQITFTKSGALIIQNDNKKKKIIFSRKKIKLVVFHIKHIHITYNKNKIGKKKEVIDVPWKR